METNNDRDINRLGREVGEKEKRKLRALRENKPGIWFGLGMFGMVGWSVAVPTLLGIALGVWLDKHLPESFSWTLSFLILGLLTGCRIAWHWVFESHKEMHNNKTDDDA